MVAQLRQRMTAAAFEIFVNRPEHDDKRFELVSGEVFEVPSNPFVSKIAARILTFIGMYLLKQDLGHLTGADGGYMVGGNRYAPDVAYISYERQPELATQGYNPNPPELAVEVISDPSNADEQHKLRLKLTSYLAVGVVVWVVNPFNRTVEVHEVGREASVLDENGTLTGGSLLPDFELPVKDIFPPAETTE